MYIDENINLRTVCIDNIEEVNCDVLDMVSEDNFVLVVFKDTEYINEKKKKINSKGSKEKTYTGKTIKTSKRQCTSKYDHNVSIYII